MDIETDIVHLQKDIQRKVMIEIKEEAVIKAAEQGMDEFIDLFTDSYLKAMGGKFTEESMSLLNGEQHSLLAYRIFRDELLEGGFCQLIQNGYGGYIFHNPFAKVMRIWGLKELSKLIYDAKAVYDEHREDLEKERTDEEFMAMYEQYEIFDEMEEAFMDKEEYYTAKIAEYVDGHIELFASIVSKEETETM